MKHILSTTVALFLAAAPFAGAQEESPSPGKLGLRATDPSSRSEPTVVVPSESSDEDYPKPGTPLTTATPANAAATPSPSASPTKAAARSKSPAATKAASPSPSPAGAAVAAPKAAEPAVRELENKWLAALQSHDVATVQTLVADNYIGVTATGKFVNKAGLLAQVRNDKSTYESGTNTRMDVRVHGDTAVVVGTTRQVGKDAEGKAFTYYYRWTDTWSQRSGKWLCIASQSVQVPR